MKRIQRRATRFLGIVLLVGALLVGGLVGISSSVEAGGSTTYTEDFEDDAILAPPTEDWYTFSTGGTGSAFVADDQALGDKSLRIELDSGGFHPLFESAWDYCDATSVSFAIRYVDVTSGGFTVQIENSAVDNLFRLEVRETTGDLMQGIVQTDTNLATAQITDPVMPDTWYNVTIDGIDCDDGQATFSDLDGLNQVNVDAAGSMSDLMQLAVRPVSTNTDYIWIDNLSVTFGTPQGVGDGDSGGAGAFGGIFQADLAPVASAAFEYPATHFDIGPDEKTIIVRLGDNDTAGEHTIRTYFGSSWVERASLEVDDCELVGGSLNANLGGVVAGNKNVGYMDCDSDTELITEIFIKSNTLGEPIRPSGCDHDACQENINDLEDNDTPDDFPQSDWIDQFLALDVDYNGFNTQGGASGTCFSWCFLYNGFTDQTLIAMAYTTATGQVGVWGHMSKEGFGNDDDSENMVLANGFSAGSGDHVDDLCAWGYEGQSYVGAADNNGGASIWRVDIEEGAGNNGESGGDDLFEFSSVNIWNSPPSITNIRGLACGQNLVSLRHAGGVSTYDWTLSNSGLQHQWTESATASPESHLLDGSDDGRWLIWRHNTTHFTVNRWTDGVQFATLNATTATTFPVLDVDLGANANSAWAAGADDGLRWDISASTAGSGGVIGDCPDVNDDAVCDTVLPPSTTTGAPSLGGSSTLGANADALLGVPGSGNMLFAILLILGLATVGGGTGSRFGAGTLMTALGAAGGFALSFFMGLLSPGVAFTVLFVCGLAVVGFMFLRR